MPPDLSNLVPFQLPTQPGMASASSEHRQICAAGDRSRRRRLYYFKSTPRPTAAAVYGCARVLLNVELEERAPMSVASALLRRLPRFLLNLGRASVAGEPRWLV